MLVKYQTVCRLMYSDCIQQLTTHFNDIVAYETHKINIYLYAQNLSCFSIILIISIISHIMWGNICFYFQQQRRVEMLLTKYN